MNSFVNARRLRLALDYSYRTFVRSGVSTKPGEVHCSSPRAPGWAARRTRSAAYTEQRTTTSAQRAHGAAQEVPGPLSRRTSSSYEVVRMTRSNWDR
jgi:hypothetical protein